MKITIEVEDNISNARLIHGLSYLYARVVDVEDDKTQQTLPKGVYTPLSQITESRRYTDVDTDGDTDEEEVPYIDDDGTLELWAQYIVTDLSQDAYQCKHKPTPRNMVWRASHIPGNKVANAPSHYAITDRPWVKTLRRVRRHSS